VLYRFISKDIIYSMLFVHCCCRKINNQYKKIDLDSTLKKHSHFNIQYYNVSVKFFQCSVLYSYGILRISSPFVSRVSHVTVWVTFSIWFWFQSIYSVWTHCLLNEDIHVKDMSTITYKIQLTYKIRKVTWNINGNCYF